MGDAEMEVEEYLIASEKEKLKNTNILKAGHHCSRTASSNMFLASTNTPAAICSCSIRNTFGHPHSETLNNFKNNHVQYLITHEQGNIVFNFYTN
jgi:competence protein ComEC